MSCSFPQELINLQGGAQFQHVGIKAKKEVERASVPITKVSLLPLRILCPSNQTTAILTPFEKKHHQGGQTM